MLQRVIGEHIHLETLLCPSPWMIKADRSQIEQVVLNIVVNARDAMPDGGALTISTSNLRLDASNASLYPEASNGEYVELSVRDTGVGMSEEVRSRIEPFFTTKPVGKGVGLGLSMVYGVVRQIGAFISCESRINEGTVIRILFPRTSEMTDRERAPDPEERPRGGTETVSVVEDNEDVRRIAQDFLLREGYRVLAAENGEKAIGQARAVRVDPVLTDVVMPGMNGREVADRVRGIHPDIRVMFMSGYPSDAISRHGVLESSVNFLQKPFSRERLLQQIRDALDRRSPQ